MIQCLNADFLYSIFLYILIFFQVKDLFNSLGVKFTALELDKEGNKICKIAWNSETIILRT